MDPESAERSNDFTVYEESLHMSDGSWAIRSGNATVYGFTGRKYIFVSSVNLSLYSQVPVNNGGGNYNSGNYNSGGNYDSGTSGTNRKWVTCTLCNGTGVWKKNYAPKYNGQSITEWCDICKGYDHKHYHETCSSCNGKGGYYR